MASRHTEANAKAALDFFLKLSKDEHCESILFSPVNLAVALKVLLSGARGHTADELQKEAPDYECEIPEGSHKEFHKILAQLDKPSRNYELSFANQLYGDKSIAFVQQFLFCALKQYLMEVDSVDFHKAPEEARKLINLWVEVQTHGKIQDLLPEFNDEITCLIDLLLVNALYFKGQWEVQFDKELTKESSFYLNERDTKTVELMHRRGHYKTGTIESSQVQFQVLEIPYKDHELSVFILLPKDYNPSSLQQLEEELSYEKLLEWTSETCLKVEEVDVAIPKTRLEMSIPALKFLEALGLHNVSNPEKADLSGITSTEMVAVFPLFVCNERCRTGHHKKKEEKTFSMSANLSGNIRQLPMANLFSFA
ncbi:SERPIN domain-containing protein [Podarcis lilfordi]|uniref:SERPIN domain-containing protein n=1 Tax=Podarcis lilfordi TaxID=74358 RepID=A0AA35P906_9SAUR|nr:SERPIN domain-containing protein [Podarcis lilfordi]